MLIGGIDIGGTKLGACIGRLHPDGSVGLIESIQRPARPDAPAAPQLDRLADDLDRLAASAGETIRAFGISCPGPYDRSTRTLLDLPNMPGWQRFALGGWADQRLGGRARIMNDANAGALAEFLWGGFGTPEVLVFLTMSTGLGAGIVIEGRVFEGRRGFAGEVGRIQLSEQGPVGFGAFGTAEGYASGPGIVQLAVAERLRCEQTGTPSSLRPDTPDAKAVCDAAVAGDAAARAAIHTSAARLGQLIGTLANVLEPDVVVLGTIGSRHPGLFIPGALAAARTFCHASIADTLRIEPSTLTDRWQMQCLAIAARSLDGQDSG